MSTDTAIAAQLAAALATIACHLDGVANGSGLSLDICRDALDAAASALDGSPIGPLVADDESDPETWGAWAETRVRLVDAFDDELVLIG